MACVNIVIAARRADILTAPRRARKLYPEVLRDMSETETSSKFSLAESGAPLGTADELEYGSGGGTSLGRRRSLAEAAWDASWRPDLEIGHGHGHGGDSYLGAGDSSPRHLAAIEDPWDSSSPAMKRDWTTDDRIEDVSRSARRDRNEDLNQDRDPYPESRRLRAGSGSDGGESDDNEDKNAASSSPYHPLPLRSASEMSAAQRAAAAAVAAAAAAGGGTDRRPPPDLYHGGRV